MLNYARSPEERRLTILRGIGQDLTNLEIATEIGVNKWLIIKDLRVMKYNRDPELKQAYLDQETRALAKRRSLTNVKDERFHQMTGMTFREKNFENMIHYYRAELIKILESKDEDAAIMCLSRNVQRTLERNDITSGIRGMHQISSKARDYLPLSKNR